MNPEMYKRMAVLCERICVETDDEKFMLLIVELNQLLEETDRPTPPPE